MPQQLGETKADTAIFYQLLANVTLGGIINNTVWFALTYFVYLETQSVMATGFVGGIYLVAVTLSGFWLGSLVDHYKKKTVMVWSGLASLALFGLSLLLYFLIAPSGAFKDPGNVWLWVFVVILMIGVISGNLRTIALPTLTTILIPADRRDKANGLVGSTSGAAFLVVSVLSGLLIGFWGMGGVLVVSVSLTLVALAHLLSIPLIEKTIVYTEDGPPAKVDIRGTLKVVKVIPGLLALILFATFNNFLAGVFMALMDAYGLSMMSVQAWGILWGVVSVGFILGGLVIARRGLGANPLRTLFLANIALWVISATFTLQASVLPLAVGMFFYMALIPAIEAAEQTIIQKVVPPERQGRVFGFAQSVELAASPLTAFLIGPITQLIFIPFMTVGAGVELLGGWFGTGPDRGIALVFVLTGIIGLIISLLAMRSKYYGLLSRHYQAAPQK